jgi:hypothetical protein
MHSSAWIRPQEWAGIWKNERNSAFGDGQDRGATLRSNKRRFRFSSLHITGNKFERPAGRGVSQTCRHRSGCGRICESCVWSEAQPCPMSCGRTQGNVAPAVTFYAAWCGAGPRSLLTSASSSSTRSSKATNRIPRPCHGTGVQVPPSAPQVDDSIDTFQILGRFTDDSAPS